MSFYPGISVTVKWVWIITKFAIIVYNNYLHILELCDNMWSIKCLERRHCYPDKLPSYQELTRMFH